MAERLTNGPEQRDADKEALDKLNKERSVELQQERERQAEKSSERSVETSLAEAKEAAAKAEKVAEKVEAAPAEKKKAPSRAHRKQLQRASYKKTMKETQGQMKAPQRAFSKTIHNPAVEKASEVVGSTVARPNAILAGSLTAFLFTLAIYLVAKYYGYPLTGTETIAAFVVGWAVGLLFDYLRVMITGKKI